MVALKLSGELRLVHADVYDYIFRGLIGASARLARKQARLKGELMNRQDVSRFLQGCLTFAVCAVLGVGSLQAQVDTGSITGSVTDSSGAVVGGAKVTLTNEGTGTTLSTVTGADGVYDFSPVRIGSYRLETAASGFKKEVHAHSRRERPRAPELQAPTRSCQRDRGSN
jgi:hypothetical protein